MRTFVWLALSGFVVWLAVNGSAQGPAAGTKTTYLVVYRPGPGWITGKPITEQPLKGHGRYMLSLYTKGALKSAGPFLQR